MKSLIRQYLNLFLISGGVVLVDQLTKSLLRSRMTLGGSWPLDGWLLHLFRIVRTENSGAAFSMGQGFGPVILVFGIIAVLAIIYYYPRLPQGQPLLQSSVGLILGGALGNLIDRLTVGQVTDFISIRFFAVVNVADICLTFGVAGVILWTILESRRPENPQ